MGGIVSGIVGGVLGNKAAKKQARATREAAQLAVQQVAPFRDVGIQAQSALAGALGLQGAPGQQQSFQNFLNNIGFANQLRAGSQAITSNAAARGLLNSGSTLRALNTFGQNLAQQSFQNFLNNLAGLSAQGINAATFAGQALQGGFTQAANQRFAGRQALAQGLGAAFGSVLPTIQPGTINFRLFGGG